MLQTSKSLFYTFIAFQLLLYITFINGAVIRREKREISGNVTTITTSINNEVDVATGTTAEDVGTSLLETHLGGGGPTTRNPLADVTTVADATRTNFSDGKKEITTLTGFTVDENTVSFSSDGKADSKDVNEGDILGSTINLNGRTTVAALSEGDKVGLKEETSTVEEAAGQSASDVTIATKIGPNLKEETSTPVPHSTIHFVDKMFFDVNTVTTSKEGLPAINSETTQKTTKREETVAATHLTNDFISQVTDDMESSQLTAGSGTISADVIPIETTTSYTTVKGTTSSAFKSDDFIEETEPSIENPSGNTSFANKSREQTKDITRIISAPNAHNTFREQQNTTSDGKSITSTIKADETTIVVTSTESSDENPIQTTFYPSPLYRDTSTYLDIKNSTASSSEKRGKFIDNNYSSVNELRLPNTSDVWALAGLKSVGKLRSSDLQNSLESSDEKAVNYSMVTKSLLDWSRVMSTDRIEIAPSAKMIEGTTTEVATDKTTTKFSAIEENENELTTKFETDVTTEAVILTEINANHETTSFKTNINANASFGLEATTALEEESTSKQETTSLNNDVGSKASFGVETTPTSGEESTPKQDNTSLKEIVDTKALFGLETTTDKGKESTPNQETTSLKESVDNIDSFGLETTTNIGKESTPNQETTSLKESVDNMDSFGLETTTNLGKESTSKQENTSVKKNIDTKASFRLETTTNFGQESTPEQFTIDNTTLLQTDYISSTTKSSLILLKGRDDAYITDNQVDILEEKLFSPTTTPTKTTATPTPIPNFSATVKSEKTSLPVNGETTEEENTISFPTSTLSVIYSTTAMPFLTSTMIATTTTAITPSIVYNMDDRTNEPQYVATTLTPAQASPAAAVESPTTTTSTTTTIESPTKTTTTTTTIETPAVTVMATTPTTETQTTESKAHTPAIIANDTMTQNANNYNNYEVVNKTTTKFDESSSIEASEASTRVAPNGSEIIVETTTPTEVDRLDVDIDVTTVSDFDYNSADEILTPQPLTTTVANRSPVVWTSTAIPAIAITTISSNSTITTENLHRIDLIHKISDTGETSIESNVIDPLHTGEASSTTTTTISTTTTESSQENVRMQSTEREGMYSTSTTMTTKTTTAYDDSRTTLQSISTKKEDVYSIVPTIDSGFHIRKLVEDVTTMSGELATGSAGGEPVEPPEGQETDVNVIIAISVSAVGIVALIMLVAFLYVMRKRQKQMSYGQRCRPVSLDAYSLDNVSVYNSVRGKRATLRASKRSYGNVAFDDPSLRHNVMGTHELAKYVEKKSSIWEEFKDVPQIIARADEVPAGCEDKNRYANVIPLPETRVILQQQNNDEKSEYINANYVRGPKDTTNYYIACQAPLETTVTDFWRMIWEQNSRVIIMATDLIENGIDKCAEYLPPSVTLDNHTVFGDFQVTLKNREVKEKYAISTLMLKNIVTEESREITHYWYQWPETGVPTDEAAIIAMLLEARSSLKLYTIEQSDTIITDDTQTANSEINGNVTSEKPKPPPKDQGPLTIHCSPGTGRTGTILGCDIAMRCLEEPKRSVDIPQIVYSIRRGRASAVQTKEQYEFIYKVTHMYATKISNLNNDN